MTKREKGEAEQKRGGGEGFIPIHSYNKGRRRRKKKMREKDHI